MSRIVVYSKRDEIIPYEHASLHTALLRRHESNGDAAHASDVESEWSFEVKKRKKNNRPHVFHDTEDAEEDDDGDVAGSPHNSPLCRLDSHCYHQVIAQLLECFRRAPE